MKSNRRSVLIGLGALTVGGGAVFGTGAFSSVEADRTVTVNTAGDASALLALTPVGDGDTSDIVQEIDGVLEIDFGKASPSDDGSVNLEALTTVGTVSDEATDGDIDTVDTPALEITNNGSQNVTIDFDITLDSSAHSGPSNAADVLKLWTDPDPNSNGEGTFSGVDSVDNLVSETLTLPSGESAEVAIQIDTVGYNETDIDTGTPLFDGDATITATSQE